MFLFNVFCSLGDMRKRGVQLEHPASMVVDQAFQATVNTTETTASPVISSAWGATFAA